MKCLPHDRRQSVAMQAVVTADVQEVLLDIALGERRLGNWGVHDATLVGPELDLALLGVPDGSSDIGGDRAGFHRRHQATWAQDPGDATDHADHVGRGQAPIEIDGPSGDLLDQIGVADEVGPGLARRFRLIATSEHGNAKRFTQRYGQDGRSTNAYRTPISALRQAVGARPLISYFGWACEDRR